MGFRAGDVNLYRFVGNGPTNATDPSGLEGVPPGGTSYYQTHPLCSSPPFPEHVGKLNVGSHSVPIRVEDGTRRLNQDQLNRLLDRTTRAVDAIGTAYHILLFHWDCLKQIAADQRNPAWSVGLVQAVRILEQHREYYLEKLHQAADELLSGQTQIQIFNSSRETGVMIEQRLFGRETNASTRPGASEIITLWSGYRDMLASENPNESIRIIAHELGRLYGDQTGKTGSGPGDVMDWDLIVMTLYLDRDKILKYCELRK